MASGADIPPSFEAPRLKALRSYQVLDTDPEPSYDDITELASELRGTPIARLSLVDAYRQWFKSRVGLEAPKNPSQLGVLRPRHPLLLPSHDGR